jgi:hypothetical protein
MSPENSKAESHQDSKPKPKCGIIMPIADHSEYPQGHWKDVLSIFIQAINETQFEPRLVSDDGAIGLIHERIVNNIYSNEIVICDVSSKNPNVMFELGLRLAFDKPTIIIKDEKTGYSFDTGVIEHLTYPSSLRFSQVIDFKQELIKRINATYAISKAEPNYSPFLKSFGKTIVPATIHQTEVPESKYILSMLESLSNDIKSLKHAAPQNSSVQNKNQSEKQIVLNGFVAEYLNANPGLLESMDLEMLKEMLAESFRNKYGFNAYPAEIVTALSSNKRR